MIIFKIARDLSRLFSNVKYCFRISWEASRLYMIIRFILEMILSIMPFISMRIGKQIINNFIYSINKDEGYMSFIINLSLLVLIGFMINLLTQINRSLGMVHKDLINRYIGVRVNRKASMLDLSFFDSIEFYNELSNAKRDSTVIEGLTWYIVNSLKALVQLIIAIILLSKLNILFAILMIFLSVPFLVLQNIYTKKIYNWQVHKVPAVRKMGYIINILTSKNHAKNIRLFNIGEYLVKKYNELWSMWFEEKKNITIKRGFILGLVAVIPDLGRMIILIFVGLKIVNHDLTVGDYSFYNGLTMQILSSIMMLINEITMIYDNQIRLDRYRKFMSWKNKLRLDGKRKHLDNLEIEFKNVSFKYQGNDRYVLNNVSFTIKEGEKVALVGENGSGKSTIVKLILRLYDPTKGKILLGGVDIREYDIGYLREIYTVMFQDFVNYAFTIKENITISSINSKHTDDEIMEVTRKSDLDSLVAKYKTGLNTYLTREYDEGGQELSGGQWQKLAIARTFYRNCDIIILDEPSSSLDPKAEDEIFKVFDEISYNKSAIFISHRLSNVIKANKIIYLENGDIVEQGDHNSLLAMNGKYALLYNLQASKYADISKKCI